MDQQMFWSKYSSRVYATKCFPVLVFSFSYNSTQRSNASLKCQVRYPSQGLVGMGQCQPPGPHTECYQCSYLDVQCRKSESQGLGLNKSVFPGLFLTVIVFLVTKPCPTLCSPMNCSTPGFPALHYLPELAQTF